MEEYMQREALGFIKNFSLLNKPMNSLEDYQALMSDPAQLLEHRMYINVRYETITKMIRQLTQKAMKRKKLEDFVVVASTGELANAISTLGVNVRSPDSAGRKVDCYVCGPGTYPLVKADKYIVVGCFEDHSFSEILMRLRYGDEAKFSTREDWKNNFESKYDTIVAIDTICDTVRLAVDRLVVPEIVQNNLLFLKERLIKKNLSPGVSRTDAIIIANEALAELLQKWSKNPTVANWLTILTYV